MPNRLQQAPTLAHIKRLNGQNGGMVQPLWIYFLADHTRSDSRPTLWIGPRQDGEEVALSDRARRLLAALAVPRELSRGETGVTAAGPPSTWKSGEILDNANFGARSTLKDALQDLTTKLEENGLAADQYVRIAEQGRYSLDHVLVDVVELLRPADESSHRETLLSEVTPGDLALAPADRALFNHGALAAIDALAAQPTEASHASPEHRVAARESTATTADREGSPAGKAAKRRIWIAAAAVVTLVVAIVLLLVLVLPGGEQHPAESVTVIEVTGGATRTWSDPQNAGGSPGHSIGTGARVAVRCRLRGYEVPDRDVWWYRLASKPWEGRFYATADAFYNDGRTSGSLKGSAFVDREVPVCR